MKATEIQSGDYLSYKGKIIQVVSITKRKVGYHTKVNECRMHYARLIECKPIQLEKIHLIKNNFKVRDNTDDTDFFYNDGYEVQVIFDEGCEIYEQDETLFNKIPPSIYLSIDFAEKNIAMPIEHLHELQQAMRIMGCDNEIEL